MDFESFIAKTFNKIDRSTLQSLRACLRYSSVWVLSNSKHFKLYATFMQVLEEDKQHK
jgi:IS1 family transposase